MRHDKMSQQNNDGNSGINNVTTSETFLRIQQSQNTRANIQNISQLLNTGLSAETLDICVKLCEAGVHPQALAEVVKQIRREVASIEQDD